MKHAKDIELLTNYFNELVQLLEDEKRSLTAHDADALSLATDRKKLVCEKIDSTLRSNVALTELIQSADSQRHSPTDGIELDTDHKMLLELARTARDSNLVNGKILHRSQQSLREILGILSGKSFDGLYGQSGQQTAATSTTAGAIARA